MKFNFDRGSGRLGDNTRSKHDSLTLCWTSKTKGDKNSILRKNYRLFRSTVPIGDKTSFRSNGRCCNRECVNPFHFSPNFYRSNNND